MLVLSRKEGERVIMRTGSDVVEVCIVELRGDKVRLGINAPKHIAVHREEVDRQIQERGASDGHR